MKAKYYFTSGNGIKKEYEKGKFVHKGVISRTVKTKEGVVIRTDITVYKNSGNHQYFLADKAMKVIIKKLDGTQARKLFK
jgi:hypothetical protein